MLSTLDVAGPIAPLPLRKLYAAILRRSVLDLSLPCQHERREALEWFTCLEDWGKDTYITFNQVLEFLEFEGPEKRQIIKLVEKRTGVRIFR